MSCRKSYDGIIKVTKVGETQDQSLLNVPQAPHFYSNAWK